jgi:hypothetical protein
MEPIDGFVAAYNRVSGVGRSGILMRNGAEGLCKPARNCIVTSNTLAGIKGKPIDLLGDNMCERDNQLDAA